MGKEVEVQENKMGVMPVGKLLLSMSIPMMISMLVQALYNIVDSMFVAKLSESALTAVSLAFPVQNLMIAVGTGTGVGINALVSRSLGEKKQEYANSAANNGIYLAIFSFIGFAIVCGFFAPAFFRVQTTDPQIMEYGVDYVTAESLKHVRVEEEVCAKLQTTARVLLRLTSGNQFGMSQEDIFSIFENIQQYPHLHIAGIHYYSGTQKKERQLAKDIERLDAFMTLLKEKYHFEAELLEMGPGIGAEYFEAPYEEKERENLFMAVPYLAKLKEKYPLGIEMGRFLSSGCGTFSTRVKDIKNNSDTEYVIVDGGMHQLKYYGQTMAMKVPEIHVLQAVPQDTKKTYCVCGSLCTVADVLVREVELPVLQEEDILLFERCGAYSVTEGSALFLSRELPAVYVYSEKKGMQKVRDILHTSALNSL